jgi:hypothetical protein
MSLYLCIFDEHGEDIEGVDVGGYSDFGNFRDFIEKNLESDKPGSRFPTLMLHSDCDGEWSPEECARLLVELRTIGEEMKTLEPSPFLAEWQKRQAKLLGLTPRNAYESFIDVDGEFLVERLDKMAKKACTAGLPILFQ